MTLSPADAESLAQQMASLTRSQYRYLAMLPQHQTKSECIAALGLSRDTLDRWRSMFPIFKQLDDLIFSGHYATRVELAHNIIREAAPQAALGMVDDAVMPAQTDRQLQVRQQARVRILEAVGVLKQGASVQVNVDARRIDVAARELWEKRGKRAWRGEKDPGDEKAPSGGGGEAQPQS